MVVGLVLVVELNWWVGFGGGSCWWWVSLMVGFGDGGFQWWLDFRGANSVVVGLGFDGGVKSMARFWWWVTVIGLNDGGFRWRWVSVVGCLVVVMGCATDVGDGFGKVFMSRHSPSLWFWWLCWIPGCGGWFWLLY